MFVGDVYDTRQSVNVQTENVVLKLFKDTLKDFTVHVVVGNHDIFHTTTTEVNSLKALDLLPNVTVYEQPTEVMLADKKVLMLPWVTNYEMFDNYVLNHYEYAFTHLDIVGFDMGGRLSENGLTIKDVLNKFDHTFTGHYHNRSTREFTSGANITYIGAPYQITRIDKNCERGYIVLDTDTNKFEWKNNKVSIRFNVFTYPNIDLNKITGQVVDIHIPYEHQSETKLIYDLTKRLDALKPAYPVNVFNDKKPETENDQIEIDTSNFNLLSLFPNYLNQIESTLSENITKEELNKELINLYNTFKGI